MAMDTLADAVLDAVAAAKTALPARSVPAIVRSTVPAGRRRKRA
jgi:hypothetical protein